MLAAAFSQVFEDPASKGHAAAGEAPASLAGGGLVTGAVHTLLRHYQEQLIP
jgi:hypothetical protein